MYMTAGPTNNPWFSVSCCFVLITTGVIDSQTIQHPLSERILELQGLVWEKHQLKEQGPFIFWKSMQKIGKLPRIMVCDGKFLGGSCAQARCSQLCLKFSIRLWCQEPFGLFGHCFCPINKGRWAPLSTQSTRHQWSWPTNLKNLESEAMAAIQNAFEWSSESDLRDLSPIRGL